MSKTVTVTDSTKTVTVTNPNKTVTVGSSAVTVTVSTGPKGDTGLSTVAGATDTVFTSLVDADFVVWSVAESKFVNLAHANAGFLPLSGGTMSGALDTSIGTFTSSVAATGIAFDFDTSNTMTGSLFNLSNNEVDKFGIEPDGANVIFRAKNISTAGEFRLISDGFYANFKLEDDSGYYFQFLPRTGVLATTNSTLEFKVSTNTSILKIDDAGFKPSTNGIINLGGFINNFAKIYADGAIHLGSEFTMKRTVGVGVTFGITATEKQAWWGAIPIVQPSSAGENTGFSVVGGTNVSHQDTFTGNVGSTAYTINDIVKHLKNMGKIAS